MYPNFYFILFFLHNHLINQVSAGQIQIKANVNPTV